MAVKVRLDVALREWGLAPSRAKAQELIKENSVEIFDGRDWKTATDDSALIDPAQRESVRLARAEVLEYVSRGGRKLAGALNEWKIDVKGLAALDIGLSTGGFADCLLKWGAKHVTGIDVGHDQLAPVLKSHPNLVSYEGVNARQLSRFEPLRGLKFDLVVIDVSFVSLKLILPEAVKFLAPGGRLLALVKPQFEAGGENLSKGGIVKNVELHRQIEAAIRGVTCDLGLEVKDYRASQIRGQDGNQEYFLYAIRPA